MNLNLYFTVAALLTAKLSLMKQVHSDEHNGLRIILGVSCYPNNQTVS